MKLNWYEPLYLGPQASKKKEKLIRRLNIGAGTVDVYVVTLAANGTDVFDIFSAAYLKQPPVRRNLPMIVGLACGHGEAVELAVSIVRECYEKTGGANVREYLQRKH